MVSEFLHKLVFIPNHSNILEDFLWHALGSIEMVALLRVHTLFDLLISRPLRWLSGKSSELRDWSIYSMAGALDLVETVRCCPPCIASRLALRPAPHECRIPVARIGAACASPKHPHPSLLPHCTPRQPGTACVLASPPAPPNRDPRNGRP